MSRKAVLLSLSLLAVPAAAQAPDWSKVEIKASAASKATSGLNAVSVTLLTVVVVTNVGADLPDLAAVRCAAIIRYRRRMGNRAITKGFP